MARNASIVFLFISGCIGWRIANEFTDHCSEHHLFGGCRTKFRCRHCLLRKPRSFLHSSARERHDDSVLDST